MRLPLPRQLPAVLQPLTLRNQQFLHEAVAAHPELDLGSWSEQHARQFDRVAAVSDFVLAQVQRDPGLLFGLMGSGELERAYGQGELRGHVAKVAQAAQSEDELARNLRRERNRTIHDVSYVIKRPNAGRLVRIFIDDASGVLGL